MNVLAYIYFVQRASDVRRGLRTRETGVQSKSEWWTHTSLELPEGNVDGYWTANILAYCTSCKISLKDKDERTKDSVERCVRARGQPAKPAKQNAFAAASIVVTAAKATRPQS